MLKMLFQRVLVMNKMGCILITVQRCSFFEWRAITKKTVFR